MVGGEGHEGARGSGSGRFGQKWGRVKDGRLVARVGEVRCEEGEIH